MQFLIGDEALLAGLAFPQNRDFVLAMRGEMAVQAVVGDVGFRARRTSGRTAGSIRAPWTTFRTSEFRARRFRPRTLRDSAPRGGRGRGSLPCPGRGLCGRTRRGADRRRDDSRRDCSRGRDGRDTNGAILPPPVSQPSPKCFRTGANTALTSTATANLLAHPSQTVYSREQRCSSSHC